MQRLKSVANEPPEPTAPPGVAATDQFHGIFILWVNSFRSREFVDQKTSEIVPLSMAIAVATESLDSTIRPKKIPQVFVIGVRTVADEEIRRSRIVI
jgi:limonene-1,2-epoxide hydrolase